MTSSPPTCERSFLFITSSSLSPQLYRQGHNGTRQPGLTSWTLAKKIIKDTTFLRLLCWNSLFFYDFIISRHANALFFSSRPTPFLLKLYRVRQGLDGTRSPGLTPWTLTNTHTHTPLPDLFLAWSTRLDSFDQRRALPVRSADRCHGNSAKMI